jgi:hypothetical protein
MQKLKNLQVKGFVAGILVMLMLSGITVFAAARTEAISISFNGIRLVVNGEHVTPRDGAGNVVEPFIWNGTTYLPVRAVANALGQEVNWDGNTQTVYIGQMTNTPTPQGERLPFNDVAPPDTENRFNRFTSFSVVMGGTTYNNALNFKRHNRTRDATSPTTSHNLNGQFQEFSGIIGHVSGNVPNRALNIVGVTMNIIGDGRLLHSQEIFAADSPTPFSVIVSGVAELQIQMVYPRVDSSDDGHYAIIGYLQ